MTALVAAGWSVYAINPLAASRYRDRHHTSGSKSDPGDAKMLADLVRTDRHNHRQVAGDTTLAQAVRVVARAHQNAIWSRQRHVNQLRNALKENYPAALEAFGTDLAHPDAVAVLELAPTPALALRLSTSKVAGALKPRGSPAQRRAAGDRDRGRAQGRAPSPARGPGRRLRRDDQRHGAPDRRRDDTGRRAAETVLSEHFEQHPSAKTIRSLPGLGMVLGARVLGEFGDDPNRFSDAKSRRNYAGTSPVTKASGRSMVVLARYARNRRLADAMDQWAFAALSASAGGSALLRPPPSGG